jgi:NitT/TauT family transport system permease protein
MTTLAGRGLSPRQVMLAVAAPVLGLLAWHYTTSGRSFSLIPPPWDVAVQWWDLAFGGVWDDLYSATLLEHTFASLSRVYGGFALAAVVAMPLGTLRICTRNNPVSCVDFDT